MNKIKTVHYEVSSNLNQRIVLLTDIHYYDQSMEGLLDSVYEKVVAANPTYICISGDFIDERVIYDKEVFLSFLERLSKLAPIMIGIGNHEVKSKNDKRDFLDEELMKQIERLENVHLLQNKSFVSGCFRFTGLRFPNICYEEKRESYEKARLFVGENYKDGLKRDKYNIVLSHSPYLLLHSKIKASKLYETSDLILCGHTHAGLTPRWFILLTGRCFITPHRRLFPKNSYGYLKENKTIVSAGITKLSHFNPFRYFNFLYSGEIVVIDF